MKWIWILLLLCAAAASGQITINGDTPWIVMEEDFENPAIQEAIRDAERDWYKVFGLPPVIYRNDTRSHWDGPVILFGSEGATSSLINAAVPEGAEQHRVFETKVKHNPAIAAIGSDVRGTIYAIYTFSERVLGIDPMYIYTDSVPERRSRIDFTEEKVFTSKKPTFKYRGWFINDEELDDGMHRDPLRENIISMERMDQILETLLRTKGNMITPETAVYPDAKVNELVARRGVALTFCHISPVGINMMNWPENVPFSYMVHKDILEEAWRKSAAALADKEVAWIVGFRGESDGAFWHSDPYAPEDDVGRAKVIAEALQTQVDIIREFDSDATILAALWNELAYFYNAGVLEIPEGVGRMYSDDGRSFMRDKGDGSDLAPGDGLYQHVMMMMNTQNRTTEAVPPARLYNELRRYVEKGATTYAIINVSGIRPAVMSVQAINDFLWDADPYLRQPPQDAMRDYLNDWHAKQFSPELAEELTDLRLHYYDIPYMRENPPVPNGRWKGGRAEHLLQYLAQTLIVEYAKAIYDGSDPRSLHNFDALLDQAKEALVETETFFPNLWKETQALQSRIPEDRQDFYQAHFIYQVAIHMYGSRMLSEVVEAFDQYLTDSNPKAFSAKMEQALEYQEKILEEAHKAEYGQWQTMFMHVRLMDMFRTRLLLKSAIAKVNGDAYTETYRGYFKGAFWGPAQAYMKMGDGQYPYYYRSTGPGLEVLENPEAMEALKQKITRLEEEKLQEAIEQSPVKDVRFNSDYENQLIPGGFGKGSVLWTDRSYSVRKFPKALEGAAYFQLAMLDRGSHEETLIFFTARKDCTVFVGVKQEDKNTPDWLADWEKMEEPIVAADRMDVYRKAFKQDDTVKLGNASGATSMYTVAIQPNGSLGVIW